MKSIVHRRKPLLYSLLSTSSLEKKKNQSVKRLVLYLFLISGFVFNSNKSYASPYPIGNTISWDQCRYAITWDWSIFRDFTGTTIDDDKLESATLRYKAQDNTWKTLIAIHAAGGTPTMVTAGGTSFGVTAIAPGFSASGTSAWPNTHDIQANYSPTGDATFQCFKLPSDILITNGSIQLRQRIEWNNRYDLIPDNLDTLSYASTLAIQTISAPQGLVASQNNCSAINLTWSMPFQNWQLNTTCPNYGAYYTHIYRNGTLIASDLNVTAYTDSHPSLVPGTDYTYTARTFWKPYQNNSAGVGILSSVSSSATGKLKDNPNQVPNFTATDNLCTGKIRLDWGWYEQNPQDFLIFRDGTPIATVNGAIRTTENTVTRGVTHSYTIQARNNCNRVSSDAVDAGLSPADPALATDVTTSYNSATQSVTVTWDDNANNETAYQIIRQDDLGSTIYFDVNPDSTSFVDDGISTCRQYTYKLKVKSDCVPSGLISTSQSTILIPPPNISTTFDATHKLTGSKGYFTNRVELSWSVNNVQNLDLVKIYRKILGTTDSVLITATNPSTGLFIDQTSDARVYYEYTIVAEKNCNDSVLTSNLSTDIGFRNPMGTLSGHVEYTGGIAVADAQIVAEASSGDAGNALDFTGGSATCVDQPPLEAGTGLRIDFWINPSNTTAGNVLSKSGAYSITQNGSGYQVGITTSNGSYSVTIPNASVNSGNWNGISLQYDGSTLAAYINGAIVTSTSATGTIIDNTNSLIIAGGAHHFKFDEFRMMNIAVDSATTVKDYSRYMNGNEVGFKLYLHCDEGVGTATYDVSKVGNVYNANHAQLAGSYAWTTNRPSSAQLGYVAYTNPLGNYVISGIRYNGFGDNYTIVPSKGVHSFAPNSRSVYIGDLSQVFNNQDFEDISSFQVTGTVKYGIPFGDTLSCFVPAVNLLIDGSPVIKNGVPVKTDASGSFDIRVPIGEHTVGVEKFQHVFTDSVTPTLDFQQPMTGLLFIDTTTRLVVGRVVGGKIEADKAPGMGRSNNNIGQAKLRFATPIVGAPCYNPEILTDINTGEYRIKLPPMQFKVDTVFVLNSGVIPTINPGNLTNGTTTINLTNFSQPIKEIDTLYDAATGGLLSIDSIEYTRELNFIYRTAPIVALTDTLGMRFDGEESLDVNGIAIQITPPTGANLWSEFNWPVFKQGAKYSCDITAIEEYTNFDNTIKDTVKLSGTILINNELVNGSDPNGNIPFSNGKARYSFVAGDPNNSTGAIPSFDYTKVMQVQVVPTGAAAVRWEPNSTSYPLNPDYRGYILGTKITGTGIATLGPEKVDYILRDPAGSESSATWTSGHATTNTSSFSLSEASSEATSLSVNVGFEQSVGIGVQVPINITVEAGLGISVDASSSQGGFFAETITSSNSVSTRDDADHVGADADIFIGRSRNWLVGPTNNIELVETAACATGVICFGTPVAGYSLSKKLGYAIQPSTVKTRFSYTQSEIENIVIPTLEDMRTVKLNGPNYTSNLPASDPGFGANNDDPIFGASATTNTPFIFESADVSGPSYTFTGAVSDNDSVRIINQQIALWKQALARNEREKWEAINNTVANSLIDNFTLGSAIVTNSYEVATESEYTEEWELAISNAISTLIGAEAGGVGASVERSLALTEVRGGSNSVTQSNSTAFEYTLTDGDDGDNFSIDVYKSSTGNIFVTRGGRSMCPYEGAVQPHYFDPANPNAPITSHSYVDNPTATIQLATTQREIPDISITPSTQYNIPSSQSAVYQLILTNQSTLTVNNDIDMRVRVASQSNPHGAIVKIDGLDPNTYYTIPAGAAVVKTLTVERGPVYTDYDSLMIIFSSACSEDIADTSYISVHFIPTCTELALINPNNNWIINNNNQNFLNVGISGYNYNYGAATIIDTVPNPDDTLNLGLNKIGFEMKPSNSSIWLPIEQFLKYPGPNDSIIPGNSVSTIYPWDVSQIPDGNYELRAQSYCLNFDGSYSTVSSPVFAGIMDRVYPHPFGTPSPGDGILDPNDDIAIQFNEPLELGSINWDNFQVRGVLNGSTLRHSEFINFDGTDDYVEVPGGVGLQTKSFTVEFWARQTGTGTEQVVVSQGIDPNESVSIGFDASGKMKFLMNGVSKLSNNTLSGLNQWNHYAAVYNYELNEVYLYQNAILLNNGNASFSVNFHGTDKLYFGKQMPQNSNHFQGHLHEARIWNKARTSGELTQNMNLVLNGSSAGLVHNWQMDEAQGIIAKDKIRERNAVLYGANWQVDPNGFSGEFNGTTSYVAVNATTIPVTRQMDATLEFWFNSSQASASTLFSSGKGDGLSGDSLTGWEVNKDLAGKIHVLHHGLDFLATDSNYFDGSWHHFALVLNKNANLTAFVDGMQQNSVQSIGFGALAGSYYTLGARGYMQSGGTYVQDNHFQGRIDEFRLWNASRKTEQVKRDLSHRMQGDEYALLAHIPFEAYTSVMGVPTLTASVSNTVTTYPTATASAFGGATTSNQTPVIKLPRPVENVNFTWSLNNDKIIITPTTSQELLEHQTIDITVKNVYDLQANQMQSPKTWIAYLNKNQVYWADDVLDFEIEVDSNLQFTSTILNTGGAMKEFELSDLPGWLTADITSGTIAPNSSMIVHFTLQDGLNVGQYYADIALTTDFNYNEILRVGLNVKGNAPDWTVDPSDFQYSMSVIGEIKLDGVLNGNTETLIAGFMHDSIVALGNLEYVASYDRYEVFLNLYSNQQIGDSVSFKIYDANTGNLYPIVTPSIFFNEGDVLGTISTPVTFEASLVLEKEIPLLAGWTWISLPLNSNKQGSSNELFEDLMFTEGDISMSQSSYDQFDPTTQWIGNLTQNGGYRNVASYRVKKQLADTLILLGSRVHPDSSYAAINVVPGWNWIGFMSTKNLSLQEALGNYTPQDGDLIKSQYEFAIYDGLSGTWNGTLNTMRPGLGYALKTTAASSFHYPITAYLRSGEVDGPTPFYELNVGKYQKTMNMIATTNMCIEQLTAPDMVLGAFDQTGEMRGYAFPQLALNGEDYIFFMTLYGNEENESLSLKFFNNTDGSKLASETSIQLMENALSGSLNEPYQVVLADDKVCSGFDSSLGLTPTLENQFTISPNPFSHSFAVELPEEFSGKVELIDLVGRTVYSEQLTAVSHYEWQSKPNTAIVNGTYYVRFTSTDGVIYQKKGIKYSSNK
ncbi:LamG-like jellyroll fold domain-containing protein [Fluviicola taffensis]|uniref:Fibronectin type III domain protein n=1 Tax=Fluviicola taffensis (strain DSM 16823 / NCIMB 13979 / RW262) TaxID=755732 RepID=F2IHU0_FLUTR|nr:LamG-like jellyroll fold domain-containing protein [Fluviicola taffensis]AEA45899.1 Fibronectin type III domain protein [Fluviicola taffensis DSM 16823]